MYYVKARIGECRRIETALNYLSECTRLISFNTASCARGDEGGKYISVSLSDIGKQENSKQETTDENEILERVNAMLARMRGEHNECV